MDWEEALSFFDDAEVGEIFRALFQYTKNGVVPEFSHHSLNAVFSFMKSALDRDLIAYEKRCQKNRENGAKGGRPKKPNETEGNPQKPNGFSEKPKKADNDNDNDNDNVNDNGIDTDILSSSHSTISKKPTKHKYGEYNNVLLTDAELEKLKAEYPDYEERIERLSSYVASTGKSYKSHYATIRNWARKDTPKPQKKAEEPEFLKKWSV